MAGPGPCARPPNIVIVLVDDMGYGDMSCQNPTSKIPTPNLDRLAGGGVRFTDAHAPSSVCTPTRYGVLTGRYCWRSRLKRGVLGGTAPPLIEEGRLTLPAMLRERGYRTACVGKWHLGRTFPLLDEAGPVTAENIDWSRPLVNGPLQQGFDRFFGLAEPAWTFMEGDRVLDAPTAKLDLRHIGPELIGPNNIVGIRAPGYEHEHMLPRFTREAAGFINEAGKDRPFFLYFAPMTPHKPVVPNREFRGTSGAGPYGDFVCELDWAVGEIVSALERSGAAEDTLLVFTSDNGPETTAYGRIAEHAHYSMGDLRGLKRDTWEGGHRVPFIARWPGVTRPGSTSDEVICLTDLMATTAGAVGAALPDDAAEDSFDILPALRGDDLEGPVREATVHHSCKGRFAIRRGDWVYIDAPSGDDNDEPEWFRRERGVEMHDEPVEIFNLRDDPAELRNVSRANPAKVEEMKALLERYKAQGRSAPRLRDEGRAAKTEGGSA